ncbi:hypothetical protein [Metabacillus idriensis]|uniref:hypothetical protein n=1 Tax=Metabacillus idriensis TaxID=324768 RepID=UPI001CD5BC12|nr:hypothetical protein [Metabacillus idriensis]
MFQTNEPNGHETNESSALKSITGAAAKKAVKAAGVKRVTAAGSAVGLPVILCIGAAFIVIFGCLVIAFFLIMSSTGGEEDTTPGPGYYGGEISEIGTSEIPAEYLSIYQAAEDKYGVPWNLIAAHHRVETRFSTINPMVSPVGAEGHLQVRP